MLQYNIIVWSMLNIFFQEALLNVVAVDPLHPMALINYTQVIRGKL